MKKILTSLLLIITGSAYGHAEVSKAQAVDIKNARIAMMNTQINQKKEEAAQLEKALDALKKGDSKDATQMSLVGGRLSAVKNEIQGMVDTLTVLQNSLKSFTNH